MGEVISVVCHDVSMVIACVFVASHLSSAFRARICEILCNLIRRAANTRSPLADSSGVGGGAVGYAYGCHESCCVIDGEMHFTIKSTHSEMALVNPCQL